MPSWDFICEQCQHVERNVSTPKCDVETVRPQHCGQPMETFWDNTQLASSVFEAYDTRHIHPEGELLHVGSQKELSRLENLYGVRRIDDPNLEMREGKLTRKSHNPGRVFFT